MGRSNNGVSSKVTHDVKREIPGYEGKASDKGNVLNGGNINRGKAGTMADMASHNGPKGSSGTEKGNGGVDIPGGHVEKHDEHPKDK